jgi:hypothetical protein
MVIPGLLNDDYSCLCPAQQEAIMKQSLQFLQNAENCAQLAERATDKPTQLRFKRMEAAWRALAEEQDWLDGEIAPNAVKQSD